MNLNELSPSFRTLLNLRFLTGSSIDSATLLMANLSRFSPTVSTARCEKTWRGSKRSVLTGVSDITGVYVSEVNTPRQPVVGERPLVCRRSVVRVRIENFTSNLYGLALAYLIPVDDYSVDLMISKILLKSCAFLLHDLCPSLCVPCSFSTCFNHSTNPWHSWPPDKAVQFAQDPLPLAYYSTSPKLVAFVAIYCL